MSESVSQVIYIVKHVLRKIEREEGTNLLVKNKDERVSTVTFS